MRDLDKLIDQALDEEERDLLARMGPEPGFFAMSLGLFGGRLGWVNLLLMVVQAVAFLIGAYAAWRFFQAGDVAAQLRWGLPSAVLLLMALMLKMSMWPAIYANGLMRELKRLELQIASGSARR